MTAHRPSSPPTQLNERVSRLEGSVTALAEDVRLMGSNIGRLVDRLSSNERTNWPALIGAGALVLTIVGLWVSGYVRDQQGHQMQLQTLQNQALDHARWAGAVEARLLHLEDR